MARYTIESKERVREAADFVELVSSYTDLRRAGPSRYEGLCPFHEERTPSFGIDPQRKLYHCFGCGASGDIFTFVEATQQLDFKGALEFLAQRCGIELEAERADPAAPARRNRRDRLYALLERAATFYQRSLASPAAAHARSYLAGRGLEPETLERFRVGWAPERWDSLCAAAGRAGFSEAELLAAGLAVRGRRGGCYDRFRGRIVFPLADEQGRVIGFGGRVLAGDGPKYLNSPEGELYHKGRHLYAHHLAREQAARAGAVILCEGYIDVIAMHQAGFTNAVGLMGTALTEQQVRALGRLAGRVLLALDGDAAGQRATLRAAAFAQTANLSLEVVELPADGEGKGMDPAEVLEKVGREGIERALAAPTPLLRYRVERILAAHDLERAEGRDSALAQLREVFAALGPSALRVELLGLVASRVGLSSGLTERLLVAPAGQRRAAAPQPAAPRLAQLLGGRARAERAFLALCVAVPEAGAKALARVQPAVHFASPHMQRVADYLKRSDLAEPLAGLEGQERELEAEVAGIVAEGQALRQRPLEPGEGEPALQARLMIQLEVQLLQLELSALERQINSARSGGGRVGELAAQRDQVKRAFDLAQQRALERIGAASR